MMAAKVTTATQAAQLCWVTSWSPIRWPANSVSRRARSPLDSAASGPPRVKVGKLVLFRKAAVLDWLQRNEQRTLRAR